MKSDIEILLNAIITKNTDNLPIPNSRIEKLLYSIATGNEEDIEAPKSRIEECLYYILKNGSIGGGNNSDEWIVLRKEIEEILKLENINIDIPLEVSSDSALVTCISNCIAYLFYKEQEQLFEKDNGFVFNGEAFSSNNSTKFCILSNEVDVQTLSYEDFEGGRVHTIKLKNNLDNNIFLEVVKEVKNG